VPADVGKVILAQVPLLRLAQIASFSTEFQNAYQQRHNANITAADWLQRASLVLAPEHSEGALHAVLDVINSGWSPNYKCFPTRNSPKLPLPPRWIGNTWWRMTVTRLWHLGFKVLHMSGGIISILIDPEYRRYVLVCAHVRCMVVGRGERMSLSCKEVIFRCNPRPSEGLMLADCLMLCTAMAHPLRRFISEVAQGLTRDGSPGGEVGYVKRITLVLPRGSTWPKNPREKAALYDALTRITALLWGRPSGVRIVLDRVTWIERVRGFLNPGKKLGRLPCLLKRN
jgi:hypothetical protein